MNVTVKIKNLALRTVIGLNDWEREKKQDVLINIVFQFEGGRAIEQDSVDFSVDYKKVAKRVIEGVEKTDFRILEALAGYVLDLVMQDERIVRATVEVDKPHSLRFAESVSATVSASRD